MHRTKERNIPLLQVENIVKDFPGVRALDKVSFDLMRGEVHVLVGENGAGKSTLIKILAGAYPLDKGEIYINGKEVHHMTPGRARELGISVIYQEFNLVPYLSVAENIFLGREPTIKSMGVKIINWKKMYKEAQRLLEKLLSTINPKTIVQDLSVAEQQVVEIAKALSTKSQIIVMDEPTAALNSQEVGQLFKIIKQLRQQGVGIIYISHRLEEATKIGDWVTVFRNGQWVDTLPVKGTKIDTLIQMMVGRQIKVKFPWKEGKIEEEVLSVEKLTRGDILYDINFVLHKGEILGIAGLIGSGKSEIAQAIFGACPVDNGVIKIRKKEKIIRSPNDAIKQGLGFLPSDRRREGLNLISTVTQNITIASLHRFIKKGLLQLKEELKAAREYKEKLEIKTPSLEKEVMYLSGGNQQRVVLAKWLSSQAKIIIFDEPTRGIDVGVKFEIYQLIINLAKQGSAIIIISSELPELLGMCDRILVMRKGRITAEFSRDEATQENILRYAMLNNAEDFQPIERSRV